MNKNIVTSIPQALFLEDIATHEEKPQVLIIKVNDCSNVIPHMLKFQVQIQISVNAGSRALLYLDTWIEP